MQLEYVFVYRYKERFKDEREGERKGGGEVREKERHSKLGNNKTE